MKIVTKAAIITIAAFALCQPVLAQHISETFTMENNLVSITSEDESDCDTVIEAMNSEKKRKENGIIELNEDQIARALFAYGQSKEWNYVPSYNKVYATIDETGSVTVYFTKDNSCKTIDVQRSFLFYVGDIYVGWPL